MKLNRLKKIGLGLLGILCFGFLWGGITLAPTKSTLQVQADELILQKTLNESYFLGEIIELPDGTIDYKNTQYAADSILYYPSGNVLSSKNYTLNELGEYTAVYFAKLDETEIKAEKHFVVHNGPYKVPENSECGWVDTLKTQDEETALQGGISVELAPAAKFTYNDIVDLNKLNEDTPLFSFTPYQATTLLGQDGKLMDMEVTEMYIRITDAYDENNYVDIYFWERYRIWVGEGYGSCSVGAVNQDMVGLYNGTWGDGLYIEVDGQTYRANSKTVGCALNGTYPADKGGGYHIYYDNNTNEVNVGIVSGNGKIYKRFINDLDHPNIYPDNPFKGFTTGEVYFSVWGDTYQENSFHFEITSIGGKTGDELKYERVEDIASPVIRFENENIPELFYVKKGSEMVLPKATAYDVNLKDSLKMTVYRDYGMKNQTFVNSTGGKFIANKVGKYTIEYSAEDTFGLKKIELINVLVVDEEVLSFEVEEIQNAQAGTYVDLKKPTVEGLNGETYYFINVWFEGKEIDIKDERIFLSNLGEYKVVYTYGDCLTEKKFEYNFTVEGSDTIRFSNVVLPEYFIKNATYTLDEVKAYTYATKEPTPHETKVYALEDDSNDWKEINSYSYTVTANDCVTLKFEYNSAFVVSEKIQVVDVNFTGKLDMCKYFVGPVTASSSRNDVALTTKSGITGDVEIDFINPISFSDFAFEFEVPSEVAYKGVELILTDYYDRNKTVSVFVESSNGDSLLKCGMGTVALGKAFQGSKFQLIYHVGKGEITDNYEKSVALIQSFTSDKILLDIVLKDVQEVSTINVRAIGNQTITNNASDKNKAVLQYENTDGGLQKLGTEVTIYSATATDVLSPFNAEKLYVSVMLSTGEYVQSVDGVLLYKCSALRDYVLKLDTYADYNVTYSYTDGNRNEESGGYYISVSDMEKPTITLDNGYDQYTVLSGKLGETVSVVGYTATDAESTELTTLIYVQKANGVFERIKDGKFKADKAGDYLVMYYCYDAFGNYATAQYTVRVK